MVPARGALRLFLCLLVGGLAATLAAAQPELPAPERFLGFRVGSDRKLASWEQVVEYMRRAGQAWDRVQVEELGKSTLGHPFLMLTISSPRNLARREQIRADQRRLAFPYELPEAEAEAIVDRNPIVVLVTCTIHSSEVGSTQMALELVHRLATERSTYVERLLEIIVFLLVPSLNPDGQVLIGDWYRKNVGTPYEFAPMPWLYHPYTS